MEKFFLTKLKETNHLGDSSHFLTEPWCWEDVCIFLLLCLVVFSSSKWFWPPFKMFWLQYVLNMMNKNPMCFLVCLSPEILGACSKPFSLRRIQKQRFSEPLQRVHSQLCLLRRQIHTTPFLPENTQGVFFFWKMSLKGNNHLGKLIQGSNFHDYGRKSTTRHCWQGNAGKTMWEDMALRVDQSLSIADSASSDKKMQKY